MSEEQTQERIDEWFEESRFFEAHKFSMQNRMLHRAVEQVCNVQLSKFQSADNHAHQCVKEIAAELHFEVPKISSQDRHLQGTVDQMSHARVPC